MLQQPWSKWLEYSAPNQIQWLPLSAIAPSPDNVRLFVETEPLEPLIAVYKAFLSDPSVPLPDPAVVRWIDTEASGDPIFECLAGERRCTAATRAGMINVPVRIVQMTDEEAYEFIVTHNHTQPLTAIEWAVRAADMVAMGLSDDAIAVAMQGRSLERYLTVGQMTDVALLTDAPKLCDPTITVWFEAAKLGQTHFTKCLKNWNAGLWTEEDCQREFRRRGQVLPLDNTEKGFRVTNDVQVFAIRGRIDLDIHDPTTALEMLDELEFHISAARKAINAQAMFSSTKEVFPINPLTLK